MTGQLTTPWAGNRLLVGTRDRLLFGWGYEDPRVELAAFPPHGRVLVIAAAGETVAALSRAGSAVTAVDVNPAQLAYCRARLAGAPATTGSAERLLAAGRAVLHAIDPDWRADRVAALLRHPDPAARLAGLRDRLASPRLRALLALGLRPAGVLGALLHPGLRRAVPGRLDRLILTRLHRGLSTHDSADNPWAWRLLVGRDQPGHAPFAGADPAAVTLLHTEVAAHLESVPAGHYDAVSLSNVLDGPDPHFAARLRRAVRHAVRPGGVAVLRSFRAPRPGEDPGPLGQDRSMLWGVIRVERIG